MIDAYTAILALIGIAWCIGCIVIVLGRMAWWQAERIWPSLRWRKYRPR